MVTPNEQYSKMGIAMGHEDLYFKREDLHPLGSHKGRSIPPMIDHYYARGSRSFAISSSGNAALAAALYVKDKADIKLEIFVGNNIDEQKLAKVAAVVAKINDADHVKITKTERPLQALSQATLRGVTSLRQSTDDVALLGYDTLAQEILSIKNVAAVFMGASSGTTAQALAQYFIKVKASVQVHIVQTSSCHPLTDDFDRCDVDEESIATAIVDKTALRKPRLIPLIRQTGGSGWCVSNKDIEAAQKLTKTYTGLNISTNSALPIAGAVRANHENYEINGPIVCLICGD